MATVGPLAMHKRRTYDIDLPSPAVAIRFYAAVPLCTAFRPSVHHAQEIWKAIKK